MGGVGGDALVLYTKAELQLLPALFKEQIRRGEGLPRAAFSPWVKDWSLPFAFLFFKKQKRA